MNKMSKIRNLIMYGGVTKRQYNLIKDDIVASNRSSVMEYTVVSFAGMLALLLFSFFVPVLASSRTSYLIFVVISAILHCSARWLGSTYSSVIYVCIYVFEISLLSFGIILGTIVEPGQASASFGILLFAVPLLFIDIPLITCSELVISVIIYIFAAKLTQTSTMFDFNMSVIIPYGIIAVILSSLLIRVKVIRLWLNHENQIFSEKDQLSGLYNRRSFEHSIADIRENSPKNGVLLFEFDINGLKEANDTKGHVAGDKLIIDFSRILNEVFSSYGKCFRTGGDEFFVILPEATLNIDDFITEMNKRRKEYNLNVKSPISFAVGAKKYNRGEDLDETLKEVDRLMYESKQVHYYKRNNLGSHSTDWDARNAYESGFDGAIANKEFKVYCQPKYNTVDGKMTSAEALVRWIKDDGTLISPSDFIPVYESTAQIVALDKYMFTSVCEIQKKFLNDGFVPLPLSVNISRVSLFNLGIIDTLCNIADSFELPKKFIPLEITESSAFDSVYFKDVVKDLKKAGFMIHMDDFGQGYSSLNNLRLLPLDAVKLDKSLVDDIGDGSCNEVLKHIVELAHFLKIEVIAEGVENENQYIFLKKINCDIIQGYYFSKPINLKEYNDTIYHKGKY